MGAIASMRGAQPKGVQQVQAVMPTLGKYDLFCVCQVLKDC